MPAVAPETTEEEAPEAEAPVVDETTLASQLATERKRLAGKDQALTRAQKERDDSVKAAQELRRKVAELEGSNLSELERTQNELAQAKADAAAARLEAQRTKLGAKFPKYAEFVEQTAGFNEEEIAEAFQAFVVAQSPAAASVEAPAALTPRIVPNQPRKTTGNPLEADISDVDALRRALSGVAFPGHERNA